MEASRFFRFPLIRHRWYQLRTLSFGATPYSGRLTERGKNGQAGRHGLSATGWDRQNHYHAVFFG